MVEKKHIISFTQHMLTEQKNKNIIKKTTEHSVVFLIAFYIRIAYNNHRTLGEKQIYLPIRNQ